MDLYRSFLALAQRLHQAGRLAEAGAAYHQVLSLAGDAAEAHHGLGLLALQQGRPEQALAWLHQALALAPATAADWSNLGLVWEALSDWPAAVRCYRILVRLTPTAAAAWCNLADALAETGATDTALAAYRTALALAPADRRTLTNAGRLLKTTGRAGEAVPLYHRLLRLAPGEAAAWYDLGRCLEAAGAIRAAAIGYCGATALDPGHVEAWFHLGRLYHRGHGHAEAAATYRHARVLAPERADIAHHLGMLWMDRARPGLALQAFRSAVTLVPDHAEAWNGIGLACYEIGRLSLAAMALHRALAAQPALCQAWSNLGLTLMHLGQTAQAQAAFDQAATLRPDMPEIASNQLMCRHYAPGVTAAALLPLHRQWQQRIADPLPPPPPADRSRDPDRPLRLGLVSADFACHPIGFFCQPLFDHLDRDRVTVFAYAVRPAGGAITDRLRAAADHWVDAAGLDADALAARIRADGIDVLIDLAGHTAGNRLPVFARRPAPVQITWAGYVGTTGLQAMDWLIADRFHVPVGEEPAYGERILRLADDYICYAPPDDAPPVAPLPALSTGIVTFGGCHNPSKINPPLLALWRRVLDRVPRSRLLLRYKFLDDPANRARIAAGLGADLDPARLVIEGPARHAELLATYHRIDIALDSQPYSGGLTTLEALWLGVPTVTLTGASFCGRHSTSHLHHVGLGALVAADADGYVDRAAALAADLPALAALRANLRPAMAASPLCDGRRYAAQFLGAIRHAWRQWCAA